MGLKNVSKVEHFFRKIAANHNLSEEKDHLCVVLQLSLFNRTKPVWFIDTHSFILCQTSCIFSRCGHLCTNIRHKVRSWGSDNDLITFLHGKLV